MSSQLRNKNKYLLSFTSGGVLYAESMSILHELSKTQSWDKARENIINGNLMGSKTLSTSKRLFREIELRLSELDLEDVKIIIDIQYANIQKQILWLCICHRYQFIADFMREVVSDKITVLDYQLHGSDYDRFFNMKSQWHEELDALSESTQKKIKQVLFRMLREVDLLGTGNDINILGDCYCDVKGFAVKHSLPLHDYLPFYRGSNGGIYA